MKKSRHKVEKAKVEVRRAPPGPKAWHWALAAAAALLILLEAYGPALRGPFLFDDMYLPFTAQEFANASLRQWMAGVRPFLMLSFWANYRLSELEPFSYHLFNVLFHFANSVLVFLIVRRLLGWAGSSGFLREAAAAFAGGLFLLHPAQTEAVAYVASRSEVLSGLFFYAAFAVFLYRRSNAISWLAAAAVLILFGAAVTTKEHTAVLPLILLLTDYFWNPGFSLSGARRNWRLYALIVLAGAAAARFILNVVRTSDTAGFALKEFTWYQYFFTQCRAIWVYLRLFFLPYGQTIDYDFPISYNVLQHGAILGLIGLAALALAAIWRRRRWPLASYGFLAFLIMLGPTSSALPIVDPIAERRMYLPMLGLALAAAEFVRRWKAGRGTVAASLAGVLLLAGILTYQRNQAWGGALALWSDAVEKAPRKARPRFQLAFAYYAQGRCQTALEQYEIVGKLEQPDYRLLVDWGLAYDCLGRRDEALAKLRQAAALQKNAHVYALIGLVYSRQGKRDEALAALDTAARLDPRFATTYVYRAGVYASSNEFQQAAADYRHALELDPGNADARTGLALLQQRLRGPR